MASSAPDGAGPSEAQIKPGNEAGPSEAHIKRGQWGWAKRSAHKSGAMGLGWRAVMPCGTVAPTRTDQVKRIQVTGRRGGVAGGTCFRASSMTGQSEAYINSGGGGGGQGEAHLPKGAKGWEARRTC